MKRKVVEFLGLWLTINCTNSFIGKQIEEAINDELDAAQNCKRRVEHLKTGAAGSLGPAESSITYSLWKKTRVERYLVDHLLRSGHYNTGKLKIQVCSVNCEPN